MDKLPDERGGYSSNALFGAKYVNPAICGGPTCTLNVMRAPYSVVAVPTVAGGMNAIQFHDDGSLTGAACWRADGTPVGLAGGLARAGVRFGLA
jgi:gamma-glutamyltranspeptidase/glutathione hydrolase